MRPIDRRRLLGALPLAGFLAACGVGAPSPAPAPVPMPAPARGTTGLGIVGILTVDLARSLDFYRLLGLDVPVAPDADSFRLTAPDGHVLFWETPPVIHSFDPGWTFPGPSDRRIVLEFGFDAAADLERTHARLVAAGAPQRLAPFDQGGGIRYSIVLDPDGNQICLRYPARG